MNLEVADPAELDLADADQAPLTSEVSPPPLRRILAVVDVLALATGWAAVWATLVQLGVDLDVARVVPQGVVVVVCGILLMAANGLYRRRVCSIRSAEIARIGRTALLLGGLSVLLLAPSGIEVAATSAAAGAVVWALVLTLERGLMREWIQGRRATGDFRAPVVVVGGETDSILQVAEFLTDHPVLGFEVVGVVGPRELDDHDTPFAWLGEAAATAGIGGVPDVSGVVLDAGSLTGRQLNDAVRLVTEQGLHVHVSSGLRGVDRRRISVSGMADETFLHIAPHGLQRRQVVAKRAMDVAMSSVLLLLAAPILCLAALAIWAYDRGPVLFRQERVGQHGERFKVYKLRTMVTDADQYRAELEAENQRDGPLFKATNDPRVTPVGRLLRATSIDELPQLANVLEGTMSLVGPRPALPAEVAQFDAGLNARLNVKPGVTGLWQVEARDLPSFDLYRRFDLLYVQSWSVGLDLAIILRSIGVVLLRGVSAFLPARLRRAVPGTLE